MRREITQVIDVETVKIKTVFLSKEAMNGMPLHGSFLENVIKKHNISEGIWVVNENGLAYDYKGGNSDHKFETIEKAHEDIVECKSIYKGENYIFQNGKYVHTVEFGLKITKAEEEIDIV